MANSKIKKRPRRQIPSLCRICLTGSSSMKELAQLLDNEHYRNITILNALEEVMSCEIISSENSPNHICSMCMSLLRISYNLKLQFRETQEKLFCKSNKGQQEIEFESKQILREEQNICRSEVEIIVGKENYSLKDILIVEEDESTEDCKDILKNLGKSVTLEFLENKSESKIDIATQEIQLSNTKNESLHTGLENVDINNSPIVFIDDQITGSEEYETIIVQSLSDDDELSAFHWEHEYAKNTTGEVFKKSEVMKQSRRRSKYPVSLMNKIQSLIIEGDVHVPKISNFDMNNEDKSVDLINEENSDSSQKEFTEYKQPKRRISRKKELRDIEKYIIFGSGAENVINSGIAGQENDEIYNAFTAINSTETDQLIVEASKTKNTCQQCSMAFATRSGLKRHLHFVHKRRDIIIRKSKRGLSKEAQLELRVQRLKQKFKKNPLLCQICGYVSKSSGGARYHFLTHGEKMYPCDLCSKKFYTPSHLKNHYQSKHEGKRSKHLCPLCGEYRNSATALSYHLKLHTDEAKKFSCPICGIKFVVKSALNTHIRRHNGDRRFPCDRCEKAFFSTNELKKHRMIHTGERPYQCHYCDKKFVTPFNQKIHMMTHDGPYLCEYCHKGCIDLNMLNMHLKHKHRTSLSAYQETLQSDQEGNFYGQTLEGLNLLLPEEDNLVFEDD